MNRAELRWLVAGLIPCDATTASIVARRVVDAVLPQITTAEQLDSYGEGTHLIDSDGALWTMVGPYLTDGERGSLLIAEALEHYGPFTVVVQP